MNLKIGKCYVIDHCRVFEAKKITGENYNYIIPESTRYDRALVFYLGIAKRNDSKEYYEFYYNGEIVFLRMGHEDRLEEYNANTNRN